MKISRDIAKYYPDVLRLVKAFDKESLHEYVESPLNEDHFKSIFSNYTDNSFALLTDAGACVGVLAGQTICDIITGGKVYHEAIWYIDIEHRAYGVKFLKDVEKIIKSEGYLSMVMVCMHNSKTGQLFDLYIRMGFSPMETHFIKNLKGDDNVNNNESTD